MSAAKYNAARTSSLSESLKRHSIQHKKYKTAEMVSITKWKFNTYPPYFCSKIRKKSAILKKVPIKVYFSLCGYRRKLLLLMHFFGHFLSTVLCGSYLCIVMTYKFEIHYYMLQKFFLELSLNDVVIFPSNYSYVLIVHTKSYKLRAWPQAGTHVHLHKEIILQCVYFVGVISLLWEGAKIDICLLITLL